MSRLLFSLICFGLGAVAVTELAAQERRDTVVATASKTTAVPEGSYQPFDVWQKVRYGATILVNPKAVGGAVVVYGYEPDQFVSKLSPRELERIKALLATGKLQYGKQISAREAVVNSDVSFDAANKFLSCTRNCPEKDGKLLSMQDHVIGVQPSGKWITWKPTSEKENQPVSK